MVNRAKIDSKGEPYNAEFYPTKMLILGKTDPAKFRPDDVNKPVADQFCVLSEDGKFHELMYSSSPIFMDSYLNPLTPGEVLDIYGLEIMFMLYRAMRHYLEAERDLVESQGNERELTRRWLRTFIRYGATGWNLIDAEGEAVPFDVDEILSNWSLARPLGDHTAIGKGELNKITFGDIKGGILTIRGEIEKTGTTREVPLNKYALAAFQTLRPKDAKDEDKVLVYSQKSWGMKELLYTCEALDLSFGSNRGDIGYHTFRHLWITNAENEALIHPGITRAIAGHTPDKKDAHLNYVHSKLEHKVRAMNTWTS